MSVVVNGKMKDETGAASVAMSALGQDVHRLLGGLVVAEHDGKVAATQDRVLSSCFEAGGENPVLGGGDLAVMFSDDEATKKAMNILAERRHRDRRAPVSSFISPFTTTDMSIYPSETTKEIAQVAYDSTAFLFDGSDSMPAEVGAGTFWREMTNWINGDTDLEGALNNIEESWPSS